MTHEYPVNYKPLTTFFTPDTSLHKQGVDMLKKGKIAAIVLAGGHGSRLGYNAPKGCFPVYEEKSLYQLLAEKTHQASTLYSCDLHLGIMTSDATHQKTIEHFEQANYFGLKKSQACFFQQENLPLEDIFGQVLANSAPDGNGALFWHFANSGHLAKWKSLGIEHVIVFPVDNALADPFQPDLIGLHTAHNNDVSIVGITRETPLEQVGVLVEQGSKIAVIEYSEMPDSERLAKGPSGELKYPLANISYFAFSMAFMHKMVQMPISMLPLHKAKKKVIIDEVERDCYKSEYFIFDTLSYCQNAEVLLLPREEYFAPLKNKTGPQSIETVRSALKSKNKNQQ